MSLVIGSNSSYLSFSLKSKYTSFMILFILLKEKERTSHDYIREELAVLKEKISHISGCLLDIKGPTVIDT